MCYCSSIGKFQDYNWQATSLVPSDDSDVEKSITNEREKRSEEFFEDDKSELSEIRGDLLASQTVFRPYFKVSRYNIRRQRIPG